MQQLYPFNFAHGRRGGRYEFLETDISGKPIIRVVSHCEDYGSEITEYFDLTEYLLLFRGSRAEANLLATIGMYLNTDEDHDAMSAFAECLEFAD